MLIRGYALQTSQANGLWIDGWCGREFHASFTASQTITYIKITGYVPTNHIQVNQLTLTVNNRFKVDEFEIKEGELFTIDLPLEISCDESFQIIIKANKSISGIGKKVNNDSRSLVFLLKEIQFLSSLSEDAKKSPIKSIVVRENSTLLDDDTREHDYTSKVKQELVNFEKREVVHDLPGSFHYVVNKYLSPAFKKITGHQNHVDFFVFEIETHFNRLKRPIRIASIGSGDCLQELQMAQAFGRDKQIVFDCYELNSALLERGKEKANELTIEMGFFEQDFNDIKFQHEYDIFFASHSLHHVVNLEGLFESIDVAGVPGYFFLINDVIGRNGHMSWPKAQAFLESLWETLPERLKWNSFFEQSDFQLPNWDCSSEGFEGIRAQDILPLLADNFKFEVFFPFFSFIQRIIDRAYGHNYDIDTSNPGNDIALLDHLWYMDELFLSAKYLPPTSMIAKVVDPKKQIGSLKSRFYESVEEACYWNFLDSAEEIEQFRSEQVLKVIDGGQ